MTPQQLGDELSHMTPVSLTFPVYKMEAVTSSYLKVMRVGEGKHVCQTCSGQHLEMVDNNHSNGG